MGKQRMSRLYVAMPEGTARAPFAGFAPWDPSRPLAPDDCVVSLDEAWRSRADTASVLRQALRVADDAKASAVVLLNGAGEQLPGFTLARGVVSPKGRRSEWFPLVLRDEHYRADAHRAEAELYRDRIGDRLLRPEAVAPDKQHLIADDRQRAARVLGLEYRGRVLDVGTSDGTLLLETVRRWNLSEAVGVDVAQSAIAEATAALAADPSLAGRVSFIEAFIEDLAFPDGHFDMVAACETLEHIGPGQFDRALANLLRMLRPGGDLLMTVPNRFPDVRYEREGRARWSWPAHHQFFTQLAVRHLLAPHFTTLAFTPLYDKEAPGDSIYLICRASGRRP
jgi:SAM-dependent methyltransferase